MEKELQGRLAEGLRHAGADITDAGVLEFTVPPDEAHGDLTTNAAMVWGKRLGTNPRALAADLAARLEGFPGIARIEIAGPGFLNLRLADEVLFEVLNRAVAAGKDYGCGEDAAGQYIQVEFVSANPTGPLNAVSARAAAYGDALARALRCTGARVEREFYVNDVGTQIDLLGASVRARGRELKGEPLVLPEEGYRGDYIIALAQALSLDEALADGDVGAAAADLMVARQKDDLSAFRVDFDRWFHQRELYPNGIDAARAELQKLGLAYEREGALWFKTSAGGDDEDRVVVRSDGRPTYFLADVAYHLDKYRRGFASVIDVLGPDHHGHQKKMYAMAKLLGMPEGWLEIVIVQQVNLLAGGEKVKMSKRAGALVPMREVTDDIGVDAARFFFLMRTQSAHLDFDLELAKKQSFENPVYYAQYCCARVASIAREAATGGIAGDADPRELALPEERLLARRIWEYPRVVAGAAARREPHRITAYAADLAGLFHSYYQHHRILQAPTAALVAARLLLARAVGQTMTNALALLGVSAPERM